MSDHPTDVFLVIAGPTASGKSKAAISLGETCCGQIINADSMQVYRDLHVLTARPFAEDTDRVPHHLYGHIDGGERFSAGRFAVEATELSRSVLRQGGTPIFCGGTGLYLSALVNGLSPIPSVDPVVTAQASAGWDQDQDAFRQAVIVSDPAMARLDPADRQRHIRAAAVFEATGKPLSAWQALPREPVLEGRVLAACLLPERDSLYARCDQRFDMMLEMGAIDEVRALLQRGLSNDLPVMKALGVPELAAHIRGEISLDEARAKAQQETRRFAKRQMTWFRNQTDWPTFETPEALVRHLTAQMQP